MPFVGHKIETTSDHFGKMVRNDCLLVDKTLMIKEFWKGQEVSLITRPRRFGKTINMSMLQHFFAPEVAEKPTTGIFKDFAITREDGGQWMEHQGKFPVIFITFKDIKESSYESTIAKIRDLIKNLYMEHINQLSFIQEASYRDLFNQYLNGLTNDESLETSLNFLSKFLFKAFGKNAIILIDEYDTPLTHAYQSNFLDEISNFMRNMFSAALKGNAYLEKGLITGILQVSKNELLSGLNNLRVYTLLDKKYGQYFGFTEDEVNELINHLDITHGLEEIKGFYNGYFIGAQQVIYNPWSLMNYFDDRDLVPYWVLTSSDHLLKKLFLGADINTKNQMSQLMQGKIITGSISMKTSYEDLIENPHALWTLLLFSGYLTAVSKQQKMNHFVCQLKIPNEEILSQYQEIFSNWLQETLGGDIKYNLFLKSLLEGHVEEFTNILGAYLMESLSFRDVVGDKKAENFYHGFVAGLIASVRETHWVDSNKESGRGLYDIILMPKQGHGTRGIVLEFKHAKKSESLEAEAKKALDQIDQSKYATVIGRYPHIEHVLKVGLAFSGKAAHSIYKEENLVTHKNTTVSCVSLCADEDLEEIEALGDTLA